MITISKDSGKTKLAHKVFTFPGGEIGIKLDTENYSYWIRKTNDDQTITARIQSSNDVIELLMVTDALRALYPLLPIKAVIPYIAYGRQDRRCIAGEAHSLKVFSQLINSQVYQSVTTFDAHSDVSGALIDRCVIVDQKTIIGRFDALNAFIINGGTNLVFCSPDAGSNKKTADLAAHYGHSSFLRADKLRDLATGKIKEIVVVNPQQDVEGKDVLVADDLLDKGGTFMGLAKALRVKSARSVHLFITHGLFTGPTAPLYESGIDHIWCTNSYRTDLGQFNEPRLTILDLDEVFPL